MVKDLRAPPIAQGRTAEIYPWDDQHVLKLFRDWWPSEWIDYEAKIARAVYAAGVPSPAAGEIVEVNGRHGLVYERLDGISMLQELNARPWKIAGLARSLAELQVQINRQSISGLPAYKDRLEQDIRSTPHLSEDLREKALTLLASLPDGHNLCHGDFHPGNILMTKRGLVVIDWITACAGRPGADVARSLLLSTIGPKSAGKQISPIARMAIGFYVRAYRKRYMALAPETEPQVETWMPVIVAARLSEDIAAERAALIQMTTEALS